MTIRWSGKCYFHNHSAAGEPDGTVSANREAQNSYPRTLWHNGLENTSINQFPFVVVNPGRQDCIRNLQLSEYIK